MIFRGGQEVFTVRGMLQSGSLLQLDYSLCSGRELARRRVQSRSTKECWDGSRGGRGLKGKRARSG